MIFSPFSLSARPGMPNKPGSFDLEVRVMQRASLRQAATRTIQFGRVML